MSNDCIFREILTNTSTLKIVYSKSPVHGHDPKFLFPPIQNSPFRLQYTIKTHLSGPPTPKFEANMNYIPPKPSQLHETVQQKCYCKISYGTNFYTTTRKQSRSGATPLVILI